MASGGSRNRDQQKAKENAGLVAIAVVLEEDLGVDLEAVLEEEDVVGAS